jgi:hypothetical protein
MPSDRWDFIPAHNHLGSTLPVFCTLRSADVAKCVFFQLGQGSSQPIRISRVGEKIVAVNSPRPFLASQVLGGAAHCPEKPCWGRVLKSAILQRRLNRVVHRSQNLSPSGSAPQVCSAFRFQRLRASGWKTDLFDERGVPWIRAHRVIIREVEIDHQR